MALSVLELLQDVVVNLEAQVAIEGHPHELVVGLLDNHLDVTLLLPGVDVHNLQGGNVRETAFAMLLQLIADVIHGRFVHVILGSRQRHIGAGLDVDSAGELLVLGDVLLDEFHHPLIFTVEVVRVQDTRDLGPDDIVRRGVGQQRVLVL